MGNFSSRNWANGYVVQNTDLIDLEQRIAAFAAKAGVDVFEPKNQAAMLALSTAEKGDLAFRQDTGDTYVLVAEPYSVLSNWKIQPIPDAVASMVQTTVSKSARTDTNPAVRLRRYVRLSANYDQYLDSDYSAWWKANVDMIVGFHPSTIGTFQVPEWFGNEDPREQRTIIYSNLGDGPAPAPLSDSDGQPLWIPYPHGTGPVAAGATFSIKTRLAQSQTVTARVIMPDGTTVFGSTVSCTAGNTSGGQSDYTASLVAPPANQLGADQEGPITIQWRVAGSTVATRVVAVTVSGLPSRRAQDIRNPAYRAAWIDHAINQVLATTSSSGKTATGLWIDDANVDPSRFARRVDPTLTDEFLSEPLMSMDWWPAAVATFLEEIRTAVKAARPDCLIVHNSPWYEMVPNRWDDPTGVWHRVVGAADAINIESGAIDSGLNDQIAVNPVKVDGGTDFRMYSLRSQLECVDHIHGLGTSVHWEGLFAGATDGEDAIRYNVACALLTWEDGDHITMSGFHPSETLPSILRLDPGRPLGPRYDQNPLGDVDRGYIERQFENLTVRVYPHASFTPVTSDNVEIIPVASQVQGTRPWSSLDTFTGSSGALSSPWSAAVGTINRNGSGLAVTSTDGYASATRSDISGRDLETWATFGARDGIVRLFARVEGDTLIAAVYNGYVGVVSIAEYVNSVEKAFVDIETNVWPSPGHRIGLRVIGSNAEVFVDSGSGWVSVGTHVVTNVLRPGSIGLSMGGSGVSLSEFGGRVVDSRPSGLRGVEYDINRLADQVYDLQSPSPRTVSIVPDGVKLLGANIAPEPSFGSWTQFWTRWTWAGWIQPQIDEAVRAGANTIRLIGGLGALSAAGGTLSRATYIARQEQYIAYCESLGVSVYLVGCAYGHCGTLTASQIATELAPIVQAAVTHDNVIACDVAQEAYAEGTQGKGWTTGQVLTNSTTIATAVRAAAPTLPLTFSHSDPYMFSNTTIDAWRSIVDFYDWHIYAPNAVGTDELDRFLVRVGDVPFIIGEYGTIASASSADKRALDNAVNLLARRPECDGAFRWSIRDQDPSIQMGLFQADGTPRTAEIAAWQQLPGKDSDIVTRKTPFDPRPAKAINHYSGYSPTSTDYSHLADIVLDGGSSDRVLIAALVTGGGSDQGQPMGVLRVEAKSSGTTLTARLDLAELIPFGVGSNFQRSDFVLVKTSTVGNIITCGLYVRLRPSYQLVFSTPWIEQPTGKASVTWFDLADPVSALPSGTTTTPTAPPTITGSRGSNAALASLITSLAGRGLITDGTSA